MDIFNGLLGLAVLTSPLWFILILLPVSIWIAVKIAKHFKRTSARLAGGIGVFLFLLLAPFADEIVGRMYFNHLCTTKVEMNVFRSVELPAEYWGEAGRPRFLSSRGILIRDILGNRFEWRSENKPYISWFIKIDKKNWILQDNETRQDLGEKVTFVRYYGWLNQFSLAPNVGESCRNVWSKKYGKNVMFQKENSEEREFLLKIFTPPLPPSK